MKKLPIGNQHFKQFIDEDLIYVDKTPLIHKLLTEGTYYFLSRPRRFGKSLLVDTLKQILLGNQDLFKDFWIYNKIEWKKHSVIHLDFSIIAYQAKGLEQALTEELQKIGNEYDLSIRSDNCKDAFRDLIEGLSKTEKVAVLIDEYDKPITDYITDLSKANEHREILREFYGGLKFLGDKLRILFITGIAKFSKVSLFSVLNNLDDLTLQPTYATLTGITHKELRHYFEAHLQKVAKKLKQPVEKVLGTYKKCMMAIHGMVSNLFTILFQSSNF